MIYLRSRGLFLCLWSLNLQTRPPSGGFRLKDMGSEMFSRYRVSLSCLSSGVRSAATFIDMETENTMCVYIYIYVYVYIYTHIRVNGVLERTAHLESLVKFVGSNYYYCYYCTEKVEVKFCREKKRGKKYVYIYIEKEREKRTKNKKRGQNIPGQGHAFTIKVGLS